MNHFLIGGNADVRLLGKSFGHYTGELSNALGHLSVNLEWVKLVRLEGEISTTDELATMVLLISCFHLFEFLLN